MDTTDEMNGESFDADTGDEPQLPVMVRSVLARVEDEARERPLVALAAATGIGFVLGRGLPRLGLVAVLGVGGAVGFAVMALRRRIAGDDEGDAESSDDTDDSADTSDDAHDISITSSMPSADRSRRKPKKPNVVGGA
jgi:hypothetical protein